ncbi:MAG TPA: NAD(P)/FAD-dependent oxidoreductase [Bacteroidia bacterium]
MPEQNTYKISIIGGGLAGLTLAIQMADAGYSCVLFEKNAYPFHKVCGEYISMESWNFIERLGLKLSEINLPQIRRLQVSSPSGRLLKHQLDLGGFGISRYLLDSKLAELAISKGVILMEGCRINDVKFNGNQFTIESAKGIFSSEICVGAWGKKSNLDTRLNRKFTKQDKSAKNYVGIKYHVKLDFPDDLIELHNFKDGYCGISKIEDEKFCLCYLTESENLKRYNGDIKKMENKVLMNNPFLKKYLNEAQFLFQEPLAISQIGIGYKNAVEQHILMLGDTAGNIAPLSGNGMSMAMRSSFNLNCFLAEYFNNRISRKELENRYEKFWKTQFKTRVEFSGFLQKLLKNTVLSNLAISVLKVLPFMRKIVVRSTHGKPF